MSWQFPVFIYDRCTKQLCRARSQGPLQHQVTQSTPITAWNAYQYWTKYDLIVSITLCRIPTWKIWAYWSQPCFHTHRPQCQAQCPQDGQLWAWEGDRLDSHLQVCPAHQFTDVLGTWYMTWHHVLSQQTCAVHIWSEAVTLYGSQTNLSISQVHGDYL